MIGHRGKRAFTLIEMAIVLVIMGLVGYLLYGSIFQMTRNEKSDQGARTLETASDQLEGYVVADSLGNGTLPAPDSGYLPSTVGAIQDPWGHRIRYWRGTDKSMSSATSTTLYLRVYDNPTAFYNENIAGATTGAGSSVQFIKNVGYIMLSDGPDGVAGYREVTGSTYISVLKKGMKVTNAGATVQNEFDDIVQYKTLDQLKNVYAASTGKKVSSTSGGSSTSTGTSDYLINTADTEGGTNGAVLSSGASLAPGAVPDGTDAILLSGKNEYVDLSSTAAGTTTYTEYTILGWFKTSSSGQDKKEDVITSRSGQGSEKNKYTWKISLWPKQASPTGDGTKAAGELVFQASSASSDTDFIVDTECNTSTYANCHYDAVWHFFAVVMKNNAGTYEATMYADYVLAGVRTLVTRSPGSNSWGTGAAPYNPDPANTYIGGGPTVEGLIGYVDDLVIYQRALTSTEITDYYNGRKASYN
jgi:prepilin-type N-terminal cleavage/methylation domain-containing protein